MTLTIWAGSQLADLARDGAEAALLDAEVDAGPAQPARSATLVLTSAPTLHQRSMFVIIAVFMCVSIQNQYTVKQAGH